MIRVNLEMGDIEQTAGNLEAAKARFERAAVPLDSGRISPDTEIYVYFRLGDLEAQQGDAHAAGQHFQRALNRAQTWVSDGGGIDARRDLQAAYRRLANAARESGDLLKCHDNLRQAQQVIEETLRLTNRNVEDRRNLWTTHVVLADILGGPDDLNLGDSRSAIAHYRAATTLIDELGSEDRHDIRVRRDIAISYRRLGRMLFDSAPSEALKYHLIARQIVENLHRMDPANVDFRRDVSEVELGVAILLRRSGKINEALERLTRALELQKSIELTTPKRIWVIRYITQIHMEIGNALMARNDATAALNSYQDGLQASERFLERAPTSLYLERDRGDVLEALGKHYLAQSRNPRLTPIRRWQLQTDAQSYFKKSLAIWQGWTQRKLANPYAGRRQKEADALLASVGRLQ
jgi:tetratricopeptide (TPR) repeat protein